VGLKLSKLIELPTLRGTRVLAGAAGLEGEVGRVTVLDSPDIEDWLTGGELVLTNTFLFQSRLGSDKELIEVLVGAGAAALGVKLGRYVNSLSRGALEAAESMGFPILQLPYEMAWADLIHCVLTELLDEKTALLERSENIHTQFTMCVLQGRGLDGIVLTLHDLTGLPVIVTDVDLEVLASAGPETETGALAEQAELILEKARDDRVLAELSGVPENSLRRAQVGGRAYLVVPVRVHGRREGVFFLAEEPDRPVSRLDIVAVQHARTVASLEFLKKREVREVEHRFGSDFVLDLIAGHFESAEAMKRRASHFNLDLSFPQVLLIVSPDEEKRDPAADCRRSEADRLLTVVAQALRKVSSGAAPIPAGHGLVVMVPVEHEARRSEVRRLAQHIGESIIAAVRKRIPGQSVSVGIGRFSPSVERLPEAYRQAREAVDIGRSVWGPSKVFHFDDLGLFRLFHNGTNQETASFVCDVLGSLVEYDHTYGSELMKTLEAFLGANGNMSQAARDLVVHVNTLKYRLGKIEELAGLDLDDPEARLNAQVALRLSQAFPDLLAGDDGK